MLSRIRFLRIHGRVPIVGRLIVGTRILGRVRILGHRILGHRIPHVHGHPILGRVHKLGRVRLHHVVLQHVRVGVAPGWRQSLLFIRATMVAMRATPFTTFTILLT